MANNIKTIEFDGNKLRMDLKDKGYNINDLSEELGYSRDYYTSAIYKNKISIAGAKALELKTGIKFVPKPKTEPESEVIPETHTPDDIKIIGNLLMQILEGQQKTNKYLAYIASQMKKEE